MSVVRGSLVRILGALALMLLAPPARADLGGELFQLCAQCHGSRGEGNLGYAAPRIAGLPEWYVASQLRKFRAGTRGRHFDDHEGLRMRPMSLTLRGDDDVNAVSAHVAALPPVEVPVTLEGGDAARGTAGYAVCASCHGQRGEGSQEQSAPPLAGQSDWYLLSALQKFKDGVRGGDLNDMTAVMMRPMAMQLADQQAMKDVIAHIRTFPR
jgi:cytochrome c oxidase subunit 2